MLSAENLFEKIPVLAISGDDLAVDSILYETLSVLLKGVDADIGQINLLPRGGRVEKICIIKDGAPWPMGVDMHLFDPSKGFTGLVMATGQSIRVKDIWAEDVKEGANPFLELAAEMNAHYINEIKNPVASILILPIKKNNDIFCTIELSRYRGKASFNEIEENLVNDFAARYGSLLMDYVIDVRTRVAINIAHRKLTTIARLIASNAKVDYRDAVEAYRNLTAADIGFAFFRTGGFHSLSLRMIPWYGDEVREILLPEFTVSDDSILRSDTELQFPLEGEGNDRRVVRFCKRLDSIPSLGRNERRFTRKCVEHIKSYVVYPLHMLGQDLGAILLASHRPHFWNFLHMSPFLSLYNSLLKSFLLNERVSHQLSDISLQAHNPGFYCLAALKGNLIKKHPDAFSDAEISRPIKIMEDLLDSFHKDGQVLKCREKDIRFSMWVRAFVKQMIAYFPAFEINLNIEGNFPDNCLIRTNEEQLETIFENLFANSKKAINTRQRVDLSVKGRIDINIRKRKDRIGVKFQDNGISYKTVSGRGAPLIRNIMRDLGGSMRKYKNPYCIYLTFPYVVGTIKEELQ